MMLCRMVGLCFLCQDCFTTLGLARAQSSCSYTKQVVFFHVAAIHFKYLVRWLRHPSMRLEKRDSIQRTLWNDGILNCQNSCHCQRYCQCQCQLSNGRDTMTHKKMTNDTNHTSTKVVGVQTKHYIAQRQNNQPNTMAKTGGTKKVERKRKFKTTDTGDNQDSKEKAIRKTGSTKASKAVVRNSSKRRKQQATPPPQQTQNKSPPPTPKAPHPKLSKNDIPTGSLPPPPMNDNDDESQVQAISSDDWMPPVWSTLTNAYQHAYQQVTEISARGSFITRGVARDDNNGNNNTTNTTSSNTTNTTNSNTTNHNNNNNNGIHHEPQTKTNNIPWNTPLYDFFTSRQGLFLFLFLLLSLILMTILYLQERTRNQYHWQRVQQECTLSLAQQQPPTAAPNEDLVVQLQGELEGLKKECRVAMDRMLTRE